MSTSWRKTGRDTAPSRKLGERRGRRHGIVLLYGAGQGWPHVLR